MKNSVEVDVEDPVPRIDLWDSSTLITDKTNVPSHKIK
jgi:hypothetical protein